jgi:MOSC domain-containing protein YiiM
MRIISINVSKVREIDTQGMAVQTGIFKTPVSGRKMLRALGLEGDAQADLENHGGVYKAVYAYPFEHYAYWARELNRNDFGFGQFGENLTVEAMLEDEVSIGDVFRIGSAVVEVTQPRSPCFKLAIKMGRPEFPKLFLASARTGYYLRVIEEGEISAGDIVERIGRDAEPVSVREVSHVMYFDQKNLSAIERVLKVQALSPSWRVSFEERRAALAGPAEEISPLSETAGRPAG